jgi:hypothetical protein
MRFLQPAPQTRLVVSGTDEETVFEVAGEQGSVLQVLDGLSLGVQQRLDALDDLIATRKEELKKLDVALEGHDSRMVTKEAKNQALTAKAPPPATDQ